VKEIAATRKKVLTETPRTGDTPPNFSAVARNVAQNIEQIVGRIRQDLLIRYEEQRLKPPKEPLMSSDLHITINNAANVNFGTQVGTIQAAINNIQSRGQSDTAIALRDLVEGVSRAVELQQEQKMEILDILAELAIQAERQPDARSKGVVKSLMQHLPAMLGLAADLTTLWITYGPVLHRFFGI
jgi:hypothetical protein